MRTRRARLIEASLFVVVALTACAWSSVYKDNNWVRVRLTHVPIVGLPPQFEDHRILLVTDLHGKEFGRSQERLKRSLQEVNYDAVALTGDYVDRVIPDVTPLVEVLDALPVGIPVGYVTGNADLWSPPDPTGKYASLVESILAARGKAVANGPVAVERGGATLVLCSTAYSSAQTAALQVVGLATVRIALSHEQPATLDVLVLESATGSTG